MHHRCIISMYMAVQQCRHCATCLHCCIQLQLAEVKSVLRHWPWCQHTLIMIGLHTSLKKKKKATTFPSQHSTETRFLKHSKPPNQMCSQRKRSPANKGVTEQRMLWTVIITSQRGTLIGPDSFRFRKSAQKPFAILRSLVKTNIIELLIY